MANIIVKQLIEAQVVGAAVPYEAPELTTAVIQSANLYNPTAGPVAVQVGITANGEPVGAGNIFINETIAAGKSYLCPEIINQRVTAGHQIKVANGVGLNFAVGGIEIVG